MKSAILGAVAALGLALGGINETQAGDHYAHGYYGHYGTSRLGSGLQITVGSRYGNSGRYYSGYRGGYGGYNGYQYGLGNYGYGHNHGYGYRPPVWHDTSHYDYHPGGLVPHGNHYHYIPGHYDYHRTGHWDH